MNAEEQRERNNIETLQEWQRERVVLPSILILSHSRGRLQKKTTRLSIDVSPLTSLSSTHISCLLFLFFVFFLHFFFFFFLFSVSSSSYLHHRLVIPFSPLLSPSSLLLFLFYWCCPSSLLLGFSLVSLAFSSCLCAQHEEFLRVSDVDLRWSRGISKKSREGQGSPTKSRPNEGVVVVWWSH